MTEARATPLIVAVSGGVDSVVLLAMLAARRIPLVVAHANHGIRADSDMDERFVAEIAQSYGVPYVSTNLELSSTASEAAARRARYDWLETVRAQYGAGSIATAHHQDDVLETIIINLLRGTGWRGLASLRSTPRRVRPLLLLSKAEVVSYALKHELSWREDSTNDSFRYLRNRVRHSVVPRLSATERKKLAGLYESQLELRKSIDHEITQLHEKFCQHNFLRRYPLIMIDEPSALEMLRSWLGESLETSQLSALLLFAKVAKPGARWSLDSDRFVYADKMQLIVLSIRD